MTAGAFAHQDPLLARGRASSAQTWARLTGALFLVSLVAGGFGEAFVPTRLVVPSDAAATARNIVASATLFRLGFAGYLVEAVCDVTLTLTLYVLLSPVRRDVALLAVFFRLVGTILFAMAELFYFAASLVLRGDGYLKAFSPDQLNALAALSLKLYGVGAGIFLVFYGIATILLGWLIFRSGFLPRALGGLLALAGLGFVIRNFALVLAPAYASSFLMAPMVLAVAVLTVWLLVKGVDAARWEEKAALAAHGSLPG